MVNHERYAWQGSTLVHVHKLTNSGNQQLTAERYIYEPGTHVPLAMHDTELGTLHFDVDHLGTPKGLFDSAGEKLWQAEHSVYGQTDSERSFKLHPVTGEQIAPKIRFQGQYEDSESGLFYNLNRYYDAEVGRYTSQDPIGLLGGLNAYQYCPNPVGWVDPLGLACKESNSTSSENRRDSARARQHKMLVDNVGYNISPTDWDQFGSIGRAGSFITDRKGIEDVIGAFENLDSLTLDKSLISKLEVAFGLDSGTLQSGFKIRKVEGIAERAPRSPLEGNSHFLGAGEHLPGGAPEMVIDSILTTDGNGVTALLEVNSK